VADVQLLGFGVNPVEHGLSIFTIDQVYVWNCTKYNEWRYSQISIREEKRLKAITVRAVHSSYLSSACD
jgi:hypothetical protein